MARFLTLFCFLTKIMSLTLMMRIKLTVEGFIRVRLKTSKAGIADSKKPFILTMFNKNMLIT